MVHYPTCIQELRPMICMKYEAKHNFFKKNAHRICNFKNICKSLAILRNHLQLNHCCYFAKLLDYSRIIEVANRVFEKVQRFPSFHDLQEKINSHTVFIAKSIRVNHVLYQPKYFIWCSEQNDLPMFGKINRIIEKNKVVA